MNSIITISRQYGSGGSSIGKLLADKLGIPYYDNEIITELSKKKPFCSSPFNKEDEKTANSLIYSIAMGINLYGNENNESALSMEDQIYLNQAAVIREIAKKGPCVIVGRCADYILEGEEHLIKFFVWGDIKNRISRAKAIYGDSHAKAGENILRIDNKRSSYYTYHSGRNWGDLYNYDMAFRSDLLGVEETVRLMEHIVIAREKQLKEGINTVHRIDEHRDLIVNSSMLVKDFIR
ncbi:MAG: cytidylate kinase-like family protein [Lachnospiraceae bacterium]|nr:cytidylate kinase-like family protein [Lachnospiraceae bacterium]